jgi:hypothetical protein
MMSPEAQAVLDSSLTQLAAIAASVEVNSPSHAVICRLRAALTAGVAVIAPALFDLLPEAAFRRDVAEAVVAPFVLGAVRLAVTPLSAAGSLPLFISELCASCAALRSALTHPSLPVPPASVAAVCLLDAQEPLVSHPPTALLRAASAPEPVGTQFADIPLSALPAVHAFAAALPAIPPSNSTVDPPVHLDLLAPTARVALLSRFAASPIPLESVLTDCLAEYVSALSVRSVPQPHPAAGNCAPATFEAVANHLQSSSLLVRRASENPAFYSFAPFAETEAALGLFEVPLFADARALAASEQLANWTFDTVVGAAELLADAGLITAPEDDEEFDPPLLPTRLGQAAAQLGVTAADAAHLSTVLGQVLAQGLTVGVRTVVSAIASSPALAETVPRIVTASVAADLIRLGLHLPFDEAQRLAPILDLREPAACLAALPTDLAASYLIQLAMLRHSRFASKTYAGVSLADVFTPHLILAPALSTSAAAAAPGIHTGRFGSWDALAADGHALALLLDVSLPLVRFCAAVLALSGKYEAVDVLAVSQCLLQGVWGLAGVNDARVAQGVPQPEDPYFEPALSQIPHFDRRRFESVSTLLGSPLDFVTSPLDLVYCLCPESAGVETGDEEEDLDPATRAAVKQATFEGLDPCARAAVAAGLAAFPWVSFGGVDDDDMAGAAFADDATPSCIQFIPLDASVSTIRVGYRRETAHVASLLDEVSTSQSSSSSSSVPQVPVRDLLPCCRPAVAWFVIVSVEGSSDQQTVVGWTRDVLADSVGHVDVSVPAASAPSGARLHIDLVCESFAGADPAEVVFVVP